MANKSHFILMQYSEMLKYSIAEIISFKKYITLFNQWTQKIKVEPAERNKW